jgi:hypothetical protein
MHRTEELLLKLKNTGAIDDGDVARLYGRFDAERDDARRNGLRTLAKDLRLSVSEGALRTLDARTVLEVAEFADKIADR